MRAWCEGILLFKFFLATGIVFQELRFDKSDQSLVEINDFAVDILLLIDWLHSTGKAIF